MPPPFERIAAYIALGNFDDHAATTRAFWDGRGLTLTPAYDIRPSRDRGDGVSGDGLRTRRATGRGTPRTGPRRPAYRTHLLRTQAQPGRSHRRCGRERVADAADEAKLSAAERDRLWRRLILNPASVRGLRWSANGRSHRQPAGDDRAGAGGGAHQALATGGRRRSAMPVTPARGRAPCPRRSRAHRRGRRTQARVHGPHRMSIRDAPEWVSAFESPPPHRNTGPLSTGAG